MPTRTLYPNPRGAKVLAHFLYEEADQTKDEVRRATVRSIANIFESLSYRTNTEYTFTDAERLIARNLALKVLRNPKLDLTDEQRHDLDAIRRVLHGTRPGAKPVVRAPQPQPPKPTPVTLPEPGVDDVVTMQTTPHQADVLGPLLVNWLLVHKDKTPLIKTFIAQLETLARADGEYHAPVAVSINGARIACKVFDEAAENTRFDKRTRNIARHAGLTLNQKIKQYEAGTTRLGVSFIPEDFDVLTELVANAHENEPSDSLARILRVLLKQKPKTNPKET